MRFSVPHISSLFLLVICLAHAQVQRPYIHPDATDEEVRHFLAAWVDFMTLSRFVAATFSDCDPALKRYFTDAEATFVRHVFRTIANLPLDDNIDENTIQPLLRSSVFSNVNPKFSLLRPSLGNGPLVREGTPRTCKDDGVVAFLYDVPPLEGHEDLRGSALVTVCLPMFGWYPSIDEILVPPATGRDAAGNPLPGYTCDGLGDHDSDWMRFPGALILHEIMHWTFLFEDLPDYLFYINVDSTLRQRIGDWPGPVPEFGYGPYNARRIKELSFQDPATYGTFAAINNAENYVWYALTKYWSAKCGREFGPAVDEDDDWTRSGLRPFW